jgi:cobalamin biosynthesis Mg chelatase CobN
MVLHMVGAVPIKEGTGRIARYELLPLEALGGRPRVDVLCNMSGIFRCVCKCMCRQRDCMRVRMCVDK